MNDTKKQKTSKYRETISFSFKSMPLDVYNIIIERQAGETLKYGRKISLEYIIYKIIRESVGG